MIRQDQYAQVRRCTTLDQYVTITLSSYASSSGITAYTVSIQQIFLPALSPSTRLILEHVIGTLHDVSKYSGDTKMTALNLAICLAPDLIKGPDIMEDASMCLPPGKKMPQMGFTEQEGEGTVVGILELLISG